MKKIIFTMTLLASSFVRAELISLPSSLFKGTLFHNERDTTNVCYIVINQVIPNETKGKHCNDLLAQFMFGLDDIGVHHREAELLLTSRKTNNEAEFHKPTTCGEVVGGITNPWEVDKWGNDTTELFNQVFNAQYKYNKKMNHYTLSFNGITKVPSRAMIYRTSWFSDDSYECRNLNPVL
jgi:hypothetical protein